MNISPSKYELANFETAEARYSLRFIFHSHFNRNQIGSTIFDMKTVYNVLNVENDVLIIGKKDRIIYNDARMFIMIWTVGRLISLIVTQNSII